MNALNVIYFLPNAYVVYLCIFDREYVISGVEHTTPQLTNTILYQIIDDLGIEIVTCLFHEISKNMLVRE